MTAKAAMGKTELEAWALAECVVKARPGRAQGGPVRGGGWMKRWRALVDNGKTGE
jgi:hypothetical protein